jgi:hypothetical protein
MSGPASGKDVLLEDFAHEDGYLMSVILKALNVRYSPPEWSTYTEVDLRGRRADFVAVNLWESRGGHVVGVEIKASRSDWLRELADPSKMDRLFRECNLVYLAVDDPKIVKDDLPPRWGLLVLQGSRMVQKVKPDTTKPEHTPIFWRRLIQHELNHRTAMVHHAVSLERERMRAAIEGEEIERLQKEVERLKGAVGVHAEARDKAEERFNDMESTLEWLAGLGHFERERARAAMHVLRKSWWWCQAWTGDRFQKDCADVAERAAAVGKDINNLARVIRGEPTETPEESP